MQVCPAFEKAPHAAASAAAATSASSSTISASLPPASMRTGVRFSAQVAITSLPVAVEPVKASLSIAARHRAAPVSPRPDDDLQQVALRHDLAQRVGEPDPDARGQLAGLEDHGVAGGQGVGDRAHGREDRVVPGADHADDPEREVLQRRGLVDHDRTGGDLAGAQRLRGVLGRPGEVVDRDRDLEHRVGVGLAGLAVDDVGELAGPPGDHAAPLVEDLLAPVEAEVGPPGGVLARPGHRGVDRGVVVDGVGARRGRR